MIHVHGYPYETRMQIWLTSAPSLKRPASKVLVLLLQAPDLIEIASGRPGATVAKKALKIPSYISKLAEQLRTQAAPNTRLQADLKT